MNGHDYPELFDPTEEERQRAEDDAAAEFEELALGEWVTWIIRRDVRLAKEAGRIVTDEEAEAIMSEMGW